MEVSQVKRLNKRNRDFCEKISIIIGIPVAYEYKHHRARYLPSNRYNIPERREVWLEVKGVGGCGCVGLVWIKELIGLDAEVFTKLFIRNFTMEFNENDNFKDFTMQIKDALERYVTLEKLNKSLSDSLPIGKASSKRTKI